MTFRDDALARWRRVPRPIRYGLEAFGVRLAVSVALAFLAMSILDQTGYLTSLRANTSIPIVEITLIDFTSFDLYPYALSVDQMIFVVVLTLVSATAFSPWRAPSIVLGLVASTVLLVAFPYTRLSANFLRAIPGFSSMLPEGFQLEAREPGFVLLASVMAAMVVVVIFAAAEGSRHLRRAYDEKGVDARELRSLGTLQVGAMGVLAAGAFLAVILLDVLRAGLESLMDGAVIPRVNPVVAFLVMGFFLAVAIVAFAWKPAPGDDKSTPSLKPRARPKKDE